MNPATGKAPTPIPNLIIDRYRCTIKVWDLFINSKKEYPNITYIKK